MGAILFFWSLDTFGLARFVSKDVHHSFVLLTNRVGAVQNVSNAMVFFGTL